MGNSVAGPSTKPMSATMYLSAGMTASRLRRSSWICTWLTFRFSFLVVCTRMEALFASSLGPMVLNRSRTSGFCLISASARVVTWSIWSSEVPAGISRLTRNSPRSVPPKNSLPIMGVSASEATKSSAAAATTV